MIGLLEPNLFEPEPLKSYLQLYDHSYDVRPYSTWREETEERKIGIELEVCSPHPGAVMYLLDHGFVCERDGSLPEDGVEIKSPPLTLKEFYKLLPALQYVAASSRKTSSLTGFHVHVTVLENIRDESFIFYFAPVLVEIEKEMNLPRLFGRRFNKYAEQICDKANASYRYNWINLANLERSVKTIEVRLGSSKRPEQFSDIVKFAWNIADLCEDAARRRHVCDDDEYRPSLIHILRTVTFPDVMKKYVRRRKKEVKNHGA